MILHTVCYVRERERLDRAMGIAREHHAAIGHSFHRGSVPLERRKNQGRSRNSGEAAPAGLKMTSQMPISGTSIFLTFRRTRLPTVDVQGRYRETAFVVRRPMT